METNSQPLEASRVAGYAYPEIDFTGTALDVACEDFKRKQSIVPRVWRKMENPQPLPLSMKELASVQGETHATPFDDDLSYVPRDAVTPSNPLAMLEFIAGVVTYRIENPKVIPATPGKKAVKMAKPAKRLTHHEKQDIQSACAQAMSQLGNWQTGEIPWKACFNFSRKAIGLTRDAENARCTVRLDAETIDGNGKPCRISETIPTPFPLSMLSPLPDLEADAIRRENLSTAIRRMRSACFTAFNADNSRKRRASLKWQLATLRMISFQTLRYRGMTETEISATGMRIKRFLDYARQGFAIQSAARLTRGNWQPLETLALP